MKQPLTITKLKKMKQSGEPISMLTAYDYPSAKLAEEAGIDVILVGDSLGNVVLGYDTTIPVTLGRYGISLQSCSTRGNPDVYRNGHAIYDLSAGQ